MKRKKRIIVLVALFTLNFLVIAVGSGEVESITWRHQDDPTLRVKVSPSKSDYIQGEVVTFDIEIANNGKSDVFLRGWDVRSGFVRIFVSREDQNFREYTHPAWIRGRKGGKYLKPGENAKSQGAIHWNFSPNRRFVSPGSFEKEYIMTDLAFPEPGIYLIKAVLIIPGETQTKIESVPVQIVINEPVGEDVRVWKKIEENSELAYFIQDGSPRSPKEEEREKLVKEVEQIVASNPNSFLASQMRVSLEKYRENEAKIKESREKRRQKPSN